MVHTSPELGPEPLTRRITRPEAFALLAEQCGDFADRLEPREERFLLVKVMWSDGLRAKSAMRIANQFETVGFDFTVLDLEEKQESVCSLVLPRQDAEIAAASHQDISLETLEIAVLLTVDLRRRQSRTRHASSPDRAVYEISEDRYRELVGS